MTSLTLLLIYEFIIFFNAQPTPEQSILSPIYPNPTPIPSPHPTEFPSDDPTTSSPTISLEPTPEPTERPTLFPTHKHNFASNNDDSSSSDSYDDHHNNSGKIANSTEYTNEIDANIQKVDNNDGVIDDGSDKVKDEEMMEENDNKLSRTGLIILIITCLIIAIFLGIGVWYFYQNATNGKIRWRRHERVHTFESDRW